MRKPLDVPRSREAGQSNEQTTGRGRTRRTDSQMAVVLVESHEIHRHFDNRPDTIGGQECHREASTSAAPRTNPPPSDDARKERNRKRRERGTAKSRVNGQ